ncbi:MAG: DNA mismatch repair protein MutS [Bacteroidetes bacterium]|nr:DNA mismatch repair protein MutS [Bacteroidota bacterium]
MEQDIIGHYQQWAATARAKVDQYQKLVNTYSLCRLVVFALMILSVVIAVKLDSFTIIAVALIILTLSFAWLVSRQSEFERQRVYFSNLAMVNENEIGSITAHQNIYNNGEKFADDKHPYSSDLDIFGTESLFQLVNRAATSAGNQKLSNWLKAPAQKEEILSRQQALQEIATKIDRKHGLQARLLFATKENGDQLQQLLKYLHAPFQLTGERWIVPYIKAAPFLLVLAIAAGYFYHPAYLLAIVLAFLNIAIQVEKGTAILKSSFLADKIGGLLANYSDVFKIIEAESWTSDRCAQLADQLKKGGTSEQIRELSRLINKLGYTLIMFFGFLLNVFFLWSLKQVIAIEHWKRTNSSSLDEAFEILAEFEALMSLASLHINYPEWRFPGIAEGRGYTLATRQIAHPLIKSAVRVANDYELNDTFRIDIITGSNMAGKSTFLRTLGINTVLALCGGPVCAASMHVSVMSLVSYMRIKDSLNESTSTFKAELDRLQMLLDAVNSNEKVFFLIDEMLRGTNSVDKYRGSKAVIGQLIRKKGVGLVATHDLQLADLEKQHPDYIRNFYFDIQVTDGEMLFDYKIRQGECKTFNASLLLKRMGIDVDSPD